MPGKHNISNALATIAMSLELNIPFSTIQQGLHQFGGVNRRFTVTKEGSLKTDPGSQPVTLIDDYAHHPTEISATLTAARQALPLTHYWCLSTASIYSTSRSLGRICKLL